MTGTLILMTGVMCLALLVMTLIDRRRSRRSGWWPKVTATRICAVLAVFAALVFSGTRSSDYDPGWSAFESGQLKTRFFLRGVRSAPPGITLAAFDARAMHALGCTDAPIRAASCERKSDWTAPNTRAIADAVRTAHASGARAVIVATPTRFRPNGQRPAPLGKTEQIRQSAGRETTIIMTPRLRQQVTASQDIYGRVYNPYTNTIPGFSMSALLEPDKSLRQARLVPNLLKETPLPASVRYIAQTAVLVGWRVEVYEAGALVLQGLPGRDGPRYGPRYDPQIGTYPQLTSNTFGAARSYDKKALSFAISSYGPHGTFPTVSVLDLAQTDLRGEVVILVQTSFALGERQEEYFGFDGNRYRADFGYWLPGGEFLATVAANVVHGDYLRRDTLTHAIDYLLAIALGLLVVWALSLRRLWVGLGLVVLSPVVVLAVLQLGFQLNLWLDATTQFQTGATALILATLTRIVVRLRQGRNLAQYHSPLLADALSGQGRPDFDERQQMAAALFVDAASFTERCARIGPEASVRFLRRFHGAVEKAALANGGVVEQFAGDGAMIIFGLPEESPKDAANAIACAQDLVTAMRTVSAGLVREGESPLSIRIGAHYGPVVAAVLGGEAQRHVSVTGDVVNAASRLQAVAKKVQATIIISDALMRAATPTQAELFRNVGLYTLRGQTDPLELWGV
ncbi:MAG: adenylate/guanylate cyclase domain-containing protein [Pseudomonadota bacterium]